MMKHFICVYAMVFALSTLMMKPALSFIVPKPCPASSPCRCYGSDHLSCTNKHLTNIPTFKTTPYINEDTFQIWLSGNELTTIPAHSFRHLIISPHTKVELYLSHNKISHIDVDAFKGIETKIRLLRLELNNLTAVPIELVKLSHLETLDLRYNPISMLSPNTMIQLGSHLKELYLSLQLFKTWPIEINYLKGLTDLHLTDIPFTDIDDNSFVALNETLETLTIDHCELDQVPDAMFELQNLQSLTITNCDSLDANTSSSTLDVCAQTWTTANVGDNSNRLQQKYANMSFFESCGRNLTGVTSIDFSHNHLRYVPDVFSTFPSVKSMNLASNDISYIHWNIIPDNHSLTYLNIGYNNMSRIPSAINKLKFLQTLYIRNNHIHSVEDYDLFGLTNLQYLNIATNPVQYLSPGVFRNNKYLTKIDLRGTLIQTIPESVSEIYRLQHLYLPLKEIQCNCGLTALHTWDCTNIDVTGTCGSSSIKVKTFITTELSQCV